jgi:hypothetical protein
MYADFCKNKSISEQILQQYSEFFEEIRKELDFESTVFLANF